MQIHIDADARRAISRQSQNLSLRRGILRIKPGAHQHFFAVKRPAFDENAVLMLTANLVRQMIRDRELQEMPGNSFMPENRARIFDRGADVKVLRLRIVGRNEIETGRVLVVNTGRIHETAGAGRLERVRQLSNLKRAEIIG